jgi:hypothetical protein
MLSLRDNCKTQSGCCPPNEFGGYKYAVPTGRGVSAVNSLKRGPLSITPIFKEKTMRIYQIWLADTLIGTTLLEKGDPPMGGVHGRIVPIIEGFGYDYVKQFYASRNIGFDDYPDDKVISTRATELLRVITPEGKVIESLGNQIGGMDGDAFDIFLEGVGYPFHAEEFPKHCADYEFFLKKQIEGTPQYIDSFLSKKGESG